MMQPRRLARAVTWLALSTALLALCAATPAPKPATPPAAKPSASAPAPASARRDIEKHPKFKGWINNVPDTGQFLPDSAWVLRVGTRTTTAGDYVSVWFSSYPEHRPAPDSAGRVQFLTGLMHRDVLALTALAVNKPLDFEDRHALREARQRALAQAAYQKFIKDSVHVSEPEMRALYESYKWEQHLRHILCEDRNAAERARRELISGRLTWSAAVKRYWRPGTTPGKPDGDLGWVNRDKVEREIANEVFGLKPGETSAPVRDAQGWHVLQSVERKPRLAPMFESLRPILRTDLESEKAKVYMERVLSQLRAKVGIHYDTANAEFASRKFVTTRTLEGAENFGTTLTIDAQLPEFSDQDTSRLIARWKGGGRFSIGNLVHEYSHIPPVVRPSLNDSYAILAFVESLLLEPDIAEYGAERGLEKDSTVVRSIAKKREELMVEHLYQDSVASKVWVSKEERRAYYDKNLQSFFTYPAVDFAAFVRNSKAGADSVERALRSGASARAMLAADSAAGRYEGSVQHRLQSEGGPYHTALFEEMRPGDVQVRGPDRKGDYAILQLLKFDGGRQLSYAESELMIDESLQNLKTEQALQALIARHQKKYAIASRPEMVMRIKLLDATLYQ